MANRALGITVVRVGSTDIRDANGAARVELSKLRGLSVPRALFVRCDVVLAMTDPPFEGIVGAFVAMLKRKPYVYNICDMYPDMALGGSSSRPDCSPAFGKSYTGGRCDAQRE